MGNAESNDAAATANGNTTSTSTTSSSSTKEEPILLNVYEPAPQQNGQQQMSVPGFGIYHTGIEVYGTEYAFAGGDTTSSGIQPQQPRYMPSGAPWIYKKTEKVGTTTMTRAQVQTLISNMGREYPANTYNLLARNCNNFSDDLCKRISKNKSGIPSWVNRSASMANAFFGPGGMPGQGASAPVPAAAPPEPSVFTKPGYSLATGGVVDPKKESKSNKSSASSTNSSGAPAKRKNPWADPNFKPGGRALKDNSVADSGAIVETPAATA